MNATSNKTADNPVDPIFAELNLDSVGKNLFIGCFERVPFRMELVSNAQTIGLLFQTRFSKLKQPIPEFPDVPAGGRLQSLIEEKKAEYTADEDRAWFNLFAAHELIERGELLDVLKEFAASLKSYVDFDDQPCFACKEAKSTQPVYHSEKLHLICDGCHDRLNQKAATLLKVDPANLAFALFWAAIISVIGGLIWAVGWMAFDWIFSGLRLPNIVFTIAFLALGAAVAFPIAWVFKKIPKRGVRIGTVISTLACIVTAVLGEAFLCAFFVYREIHVLPDAEQTLAIWRATMAEAGSFYVIGKLITVGIMWAILAENSKAKISLEEAAAPSTR